ncbi:Crp/Fnr family transcriptional regulator [Leptospira perolatii]|uniref:Crp/Fnr family transcriptional regulator n=1 Tax=Leptospira perolatii TaxID=2023191 RepID=UPI001FB04020|nr:Crp/Fnr family transcriptional regulator [Leptospira perolatii]
MNDWITLYSEFGKLIRPIGIRKKFYKDQSVFSEMEPYSGFFEVTSGIFKLYSLNTNGREATLKIFFPGELIATPPMFQDEEESVYPANCQSLQEGELILYPRDKFLSILLQNPRALFLFSAVTVEYLTYFRQKIVENAFFSVRDKILTYLIESGGSQAYVSLPIAKQQLASLIGSTPESVSRAFRSLIEDGIIREREDSYIVIREAPALSARHFYEFKR